MTCLAVPLVVDPQRSSFCGPIIEIISNRFDERKWDAFIGVAISHCFGNWRFSLWSKGGG